MEIEVGDFIRTNEGLIGKIKRIEFDRTDKGLKWYVFDRKRPNMNIIDEVYINKPYITNYSKNIIDLIEEGDYVNGKYVYDVFENANREKVIKIDCMRGYLYQYEIKSIITKEQIAQIEYKVGE